MAMLDDIQTALGRVLSAADNWDVSYSQLGSWQTDDGSALDTGRVLPNGQRSIVELDAVFLAIRGFASTLSEATAQDINHLPTNISGSLAKRRSGLRYQLVILQRTKPQFQHPAGFLRLIPITSWSAQRMEAQFS